MQCDMHLQQTCARYYHYDYYSYYYYHYCYYDYYYNYLKINSIDSESVDNFAGAVGFYLFGDRTLFYARKTK